MAMEAEEGRILREKGVVAAEEAVAPAVPTGVLLGFGSDPQSLGLPAFALGALVAGILFVGVFPPGVLGIAIPILAACGLALLVTTIWAIFLGQTLLAGTFGIVTGLFLSLALLLLGLAHNWFAIPAASIVSAEEIYYIAFCCFYIFLLVPFLKLPVIYPISICLLIAALALATISLFTGSENIMTASGGCLLTLALVVFYLWVHVNTTAVGMKPFPPIGKPLL